MCQESEPNEAGEGTYCNVEEELFTLSQLAKLGLLKKGLNILLPHGLWFDCIVWPCLLKIDFPITYLYIFVSNKEVKASMLTTYKGSVGHSKSKSGHILYVISKIIFHGNLCKY